MYGGLGSALVLIVLSPVFWGTPTSVFVNTGVAIWPLNNPGIVSIPLGFLLGWLGSITSRRAEDARKAAEMDVRSLTGFGAEKASSH
jgi:cation/acetate symporter